jgi:hypothetical protein
MDYQIKKEIENIINNNITRLPYEGDEVDKTSMKEELIELFKNTSMDKAKETELIESDDGMIKCNIVKCCKIGPIINENYCPECGNKIIRK